MSPTVRVTDEEAYLEKAISRYSPEVATTALAALEKLRAIFPGARRLVFERRQSLPIGFAPAERGSAVFSLVLYPRWVRFFFLQGVAIDDPEGRLDGTGSQVRSIRMDKRGALLNDPYIRGLIAQALKVAGADLKRGSGQVVLKSRVVPATDRSLVLPTQLPKKRLQRVARPALLSGGNPQIAKADGDAPVQAYITAMPAWKRDVGRRLDALIVRTVPNVRKAVKWNSPFYGIDGQGWFLGVHTFTNYVKVTFFKGASLRPVPPGGKGDARWVDVHEDDLDETQMSTWVMQAAALPGWATSDIRQG